jgi:cytochrome c553
MKKIIVVILVLLFLVLSVLSCQKKEAKATEEKCEPKTEKKLEMYQMSEMAALMEQMYVDNQRLKERIINGDTIGQFPQHFLKIHKAVMTDETDNDAFFKAQAAKFIKAQELIYKDPKNAKTHFNNGVDACIQCHQQKCGGPIPRIKKLYIKE